MKAMLVVVVIASSFIQVHSRSTGAPSAACSTITPAHSPNSPQTTPIPYSIDLSAFDQDGDGIYSYTPAMTYQLSLSAPGGSPTFRGFLIQARQVADDSTVVGSFSSPPSGARLSSCSPANSAITHSSSSSKTSITVTWTAPGTDVGPIHFAFAVVRQYNTFWANQRTTVIQNPRVNVGYVGAPYTVDENAASVQVCIEATGAILDQDVIVTLSTTAAGTATAGADYTSLTADLTLSNSQTQQCADITIVDDMVVENSDPETIMLMITSSDSAVDISQASAIVSITDTTQVDVAYEADPGSVQEGGSVMVCMVTSGAQLERDVIVSITSAAASTAMGGSIDYQDFSQDLTFSDSVTRLCVTITTVTDSVVEDLETVIVELTSTDPAASIAQPTATVTITDGTRVNVGYVDANYTVDETAGSVQVCIEATGATLDRDVTVTLSTTAAGTATAGADYTSLTADLTLSNSQTQQCADITIVDDMVVENSDPETIMLMITSSDSAVDISQASAIVSITDTTKVDVAYEADPGSVQEGGSVMVCMVTSGAQLERDVIVSITSAAASTAMGGSIDYQDFSQDLTFSDSVTRLCVTITTVTDSVVEDLETVIVELTSTDPAASIAQPTATVTITDGTRVNVGYVDANYTVDETAGSVQVCIEATGATLDRDVTVTLSTTAAGTATAGADYTSLTADLTLSNSQTQQCADITIVDDMVVENSDPETIMLMITSSDSAVDISQASAIVSITDTTQVDVAYEADPGSVQEGGSVMVCVVTSGAQLERDVIVSITSAAASTAMGGNIDYQDFGQDFTFSDSVTRLCVTVTTVTDSVVEDPETVIVELTSTDPAASIAQPTATVTVTDETRVNVGYVGAPYTVDENAGSVQVCIEATGATLDRDVVMVTLSAADGSAMGGGVDYEHFSQSLTFNSSTAQLCVIITIVDDTIVEDPEIIMLTLMSDDSAVNLPQPSASITITDTSVVTVGLQQDSFTVNEVAGMVMACAQITGSFVRDITVNVSSSPDTAMAPGDYDATPQPSSLVFSPGNMEQCTSILIEDDSVNEVAAEQFSVLLGSSDSAVVIGASSAAVTIVDPPVITTQPMDILGVMPDQGIDVTFTVMALGSDLMYQWQRSTTDLVDFMDITDSIKYSGTDTASLTVVNVTERDGGRFQCVVTNVVDVKTSGPAHLTIFGSTVITGSPTSEAVERGEQAVLECSGSGMGVLTFTWETTANVTLPAPDSVVTSNSTTNTGTSTLTLQVVDLNYGGEYICILFSDGGNATYQPANLTVFMFTGTIRDQTVSLGEESTFDCSVEVSGTDYDPTYSWTVDREIVIDTLSCDTMQSSCISGNNTAMLTIMNIGPENAGLYNCTVSLGGTPVAYRNVTLTTLLPMFTTEPDDVVVEEEDEFTVKCAAQNTEGAPNPLQFQWIDSTNGGLQNNGRRTITTTPEDENRTATSTLVISNVALSDAGDYSCEVTNRFFRDAITSDFTVEVEFVPIVTFVDGNGVQLAGKVQLNVSTDLTLDCSAVGNPEVVMVEIRRGNAVLTNVSGNQTQFTLTNLQLANSSAYSCVAANVDGNMTAVEFSLVVQDSPDVVDHDQITAVIDTLVSVTLSWVAPDSNNADITLYHVAYCISNDGICPTPGAPDMGEIRVSSNGPTTEITLTELDLNETYLVFIQAENTVDLSNRPADPFLFRTATLDDVPPEDLMVEFVTQSTVLLSWTIPSLALSPVIIDSYQLTYRVAGSPGMEQRELRVAFIGGSQGAFVGQLDSNTPYIFTVALNFAIPAGFTGVSSGVQGRTEQTDFVPAQEPAPTVVRGQLMVTWNRPAEGFEFLTEYVVQFTFRRLESRRRRQLDNAMNVTVPRNETSTSIPTEPFSEYTIQVLGSYEAGGESFLSPVTAPITTNSSQISTSQPPTTEPTTTGNGTSSQGSDNTAAIVGGVVSAVFVLIVVAVTVVVVIVILRKHHHQAELVLLKKGHEKKGIGNRPVELTLIGSPGKTGVDDTP